ncbi:MAG: hypothetical protein AAGG75_22590 [Bacteroidota bacterium]
MKIKLLGTVLLLIIQCNMGYAQQENDSIEKRLEALSNYSNDPDQVYYILLLSEKTTIEEKTTHLDQLMAQYVSNSLSTKKFEIPDVNLGPLPYIIIRRFNTEKQATVFIATIKGDASIDDYEALVISQTNYRKFLKKKSIQEYRNFILN